MIRAPIGFADLEYASRVAVSGISGLAEPDWRDDLVPGLDWTSRQVVDHLCNTLAFYANHVATRAIEHQPRIRSLGEAELTDGQLAQSVDAWVRVLTGVLEVAPNGLRAWHPLGLTDCEGFLALACDELVIHADDVARAHGVSLVVGSSFCRRLLDRLFPTAGARSDEDAWQVLLWANGRASVTSRPQQEIWRSHPAPVD